MINIIRFCTVICIMLVSYTAYAQPATFYRYFWSSDGSRFIVGVQNGDSFLVTVYNEVWQPLASRSLLCCSLTISPDARSILINSSPSEILDIDTLQPLRTLANTIGYAAWSPDGSELASFISGPPGIMNIYSAEDGRLLRSFDSSDAAPWNWPHPPSWSPDGTRFLIGGRSQLAFLDSNTGEQIGQTIVLDGSIDNYSWSSDNSMIAVSLSKQLSSAVLGSFPLDDSAGTHRLNSIVVIDVATGNIRDLRSGFRYPAAPLIWNQNDTEIATYIDNALTILDVPTGAIVGSILPMFNAIIVGYSPWDGRLIMGLYNNLPFEFSTGDLVADSAVIQPYFNQTELDGLIEILVPDPTPERLEAIAAACDAPPSVVNAITAVASLDASLTALETALTREADSIPPACAADLLAVAEALGSHSAE